MLFVDVVDEDLGSKVILMICVIIGYVESVGVSVLQSQNHYS